MSTQAPVLSPSIERKKVTTQTLRRKKQRGEVISMLTAYDYPTALAMDQAGIDVILVGDSLGMVVLGYANTLPVTMEDMLHHCRAVSRGAKSALLVGDMPFMSYQVSTQEAVRNAGRFLQEAGMDAVKLEGGSERIGAITARSSCRRWRVVTRCARGPAVTSAWCCSAATTTNARPAGSWTSVITRFSRTCASSQQQPTSCAIRLRSGLANRPRGLPRVASRKR